MASNAKRRAGISVADDLEGLVLVNGPRRIGLLLCDILHIKLELRLVATARDPHLIEISQANGGPFH